jgi:hypothetical protein
MHDRLHSQRLDYWADVAAHRIRELVCGLTLTPPAMASSFIRLQPFMTRVLR